MKAIRAAIGMVIMPTKININGMEARIPSHGATANQPLLLKSWKRLMNNVQLAQAKKRPRMI